MKPEDLIECIKAQSEGKRIECRRKCQVSKWAFKDTSHLQWNGESFDYRIAREPRKCWVSWDPNGQPLVQPYDSSRFSDEEWKGNGWKLVMEDPE